MRTCVISGIVGKYLPTPSAPPALDFGGAPLKELQKKWSGANFLWSGVELARVFGYFFSWSGARFGRAECSQIPP